MPAAKFNGDAENNRDRCKEDAGNIDLNLIGADSFRHEYNMPKYKVSGALTERAYGCCL